MCARSAEMQVSENAGKDGYLLHRQKTGRRQPSVPERCCCSDRLPFCSSSFLFLSPASSPPPSHLHSKMLAGPVLVTMATQGPGRSRGGGGTSRDCASLFPDWSAGRGGGNVGRAMTSHAHRFPDGRDPLQEQTQTQWTRVLGGARPGRRYPSGTLSCWISGPPARHCGQRCGHQQQLDH